MSTVLKNCINYGVLGIGLLVYFCCICAYQFVESSIVMLLTILIWAMLTIYLDQFETLRFSRILSITGLLFAISFFFFFGVEEVPIPQGAILFNTPGIAITLFIIFMSILPVLYITYGDKISTLTNTQSSYLSSPAHTTANEIISENIDDDWEIATDEDIESGNFEVAA
jgi:hypothetical protein